ncbi:molybdopterin-biosynthesis enzyme MoeA-like protein [Neisseria sp. HSC-16F19]|nr:molybdopterin-binding protein [Neisseria sp. HSC-16F19]MCP2039671.1 molybdopterin-biosynthesis enzyme MoeA-like protein [Neisseria sp. HSC-16F19]
MSAPDFGLIIIGDEILHGQRQDCHFAYFKQLLERRGLRLAWVQYLPDERELLIHRLQRSFADGGPVFVTGGIGSTPDDHTRQAAAAALALPLVRHAEALSFIEERTLAMGESLDSPGHAQRAHMADFAEGAELVPNPFNRIAGFALREHYFLPGFPQMAHPMAAWVLDTHYAHCFHQTERREQAALIEGLPESAIAPLMDDIETRWPGIKTFSLPTVRHEAPLQDPAHRRYRLEFGLKAEGAACDGFDAAWQYAYTRLSALGASAITPLQGYGRDTD